MRVQSPSTAFAEPLYLQKVSNRSKCWAQDDFASTFKGRLKSVDMFS